MGTTRRPVGVSLELTAKLFRGLADQSRLAMLVALIDGERTVSQLVEATGLSQPNASNHLACLRDCGLVVSRQDGRYKHYAIADVRTVALLRNAEGILQSVADRVDACSRYEGPATKMSEYPSPFEPLSLGRLR